MTVVCHLCKHEWDYTGKAVYATCPSCMRKTRAVKEDLSDHEELKE